MCVCVRMCAAQLGSYLLAVKDGAWNMVNMFPELVPTPHVQPVQREAQSEPHNHLSRCVGFARTSQLWGQVAMSASI